MSLFYDIHMKIHHLLLTICTMLFICSCELPAISWVPPETSTLLTGESLAGTELSYIKPETEYIQVRNDRFCFSFKVDLSNYIKEKKTEITILLFLRTNCSLRLEVTRRP